MNSLLRGMPDEGRMVSMSESYIDAVTTKIRSIEGNLKPDQALTLFAETAEGRVRVFSLQFTSSPVVFVLGLDDEDNETCLISTSFALQMVCKITKADVGQKRAPIGFDLPKS